MENISKVSRLQAVTELDQDLQKDIRRITENISSQVAEIVLYIAANIITVSSIIG